MRVRAFAFLYVYHMPDDEW